MFKVETIPVNQIAPPHRVTKEGLDCFTKSLWKGSEWRGRPLLLVKMPPGYRRPYQAFTGSHRIATCRKVNLDPECHIMDDKRVRSLYYAWAKGKIPYPDIGTKLEKLGHYIAACIFDRDCISKGYENENCST